MLGDEYRAMIVAAGRRLPRGKREDGRRRARMSLVARVYADIWWGNPPEVAKQVALIHGPPRLLYRENYNGGGEYVLSGGALGFPMKVKSFEELAKEAARSSALAWTLLWSNICEEMFMAAKMNPMVAMYGQLDYVGWSEHIQAKRKAMGLDYTKPALTFPDDSEKCVVIYNATVWERKMRYRQ